MYISRIREHSRLAKSRPDLGGCLPSLALMNDPLQVTTLKPRARVRFLRPSSGIVSQKPLEQAIVRPRTSPPRASVSATSILNPFFGYPVLFVGSDVAPEHGRRRKRDLLYTLARLFWARWNSHVKGFFLVLLFISSSESSRKWFYDRLRNRARNLESHRPLSLR